MKIADLESMLFIVGAPRCGTTSLAGWLKNHPRICFPLVKEPHFFLQHELRAMAPEAALELTEREYLDRYYAHCEGDRRIGLDGSVSYLYDPESLLPALDMWPNAKFVIGVRDPMTMLPSLHARLLVTGDEQITSFDQAWAAIPDRMAGRRIPASCLEPRWLRYDEGGRLGHYVERFFDVIGRERTLVVVFDDLIADPEGQYRRLCEFAGIEPDAAVDLTRRRGGKGIRWGWLQRLLKRPPKATRAYLAGKAFRQRAKAVDDDDDKVAERIFAVRKRLLRWNQVPYVKTEMPVALQEDIRARLKNDIAHLGRLIGRDLSHWLEVRAGRSG
jgi:hypothetical protein